MQCNSLQSSYDLDKPEDFAAWVGKCINELNVRAKLGVNIIAVENGKKTNVSPAADYRICEGDIMVVLGDTYALSAVQKL